MTAGEDNPIAAGRRKRYRRWLENRWPLVGAWLRRQALSALAGDGSAQASRLLGEASARAARPAVRAAALSALLRLAADGHVPAQEALCGLVITDDHPLAREQALAADYAPREETRRALFYFLTGQWERYDSLDFDRRLLRAAYAAGDAATRRRVAAAARAAGRLEWLEIVAAGDRGRRVDAMTDLEWKTTLTVLCGAGRWSEAWRLAQEAPPRWAVLLLQQLRRSGWEAPERDREGFHRLTALAGDWVHEDFRAMFHRRALLTGHSAAVRAIAMHRSGRLVASGGSDGGVRLWGVPNGEPLAVLVESGPAVHALAVSPDGRLLAAGGKDGWVYLWRLPGGNLLGKLKGHGRAVACLAFTPDSQVLVSGGQDGVVQLWQMPEGAALRTLDKHAAAIQDLALTPDGKVLATAGADCTVRLWGLPDGKPARALAGHRNEEADAVLCLAVRPDGGLLASGGTDGAVCLWRLPEGDWQGTLDEHQGDVACLAFGPDGRVLASGGADQRLRFWEPPDDSARAGVEAHAGAVTRLAFHPGGDLVATASGGGLGHDHSVRLWHVPTGETARTLDGHGRYVTELAFSPDGQTLASCSGDGTIRLWTSDLARLVDLPTGKSTIKDMEWVQRALRRDDLGGAEREALRFLDALMRWRRRLDVLVDDAGPRVVEVGAFDIEIESEPR